MDRPDQTPPSDDSRGTPFGRLPSLTHQIKELIHDYPEGIGIIKELLQNADDAGARSLRVIVDWRSHPTARLPAASMARLQGPALLFCNDAVFSDDDFDRIQEIYQSGKVRSAEQTGQFGKGFNTVYNVTDWPSFITGGRVAFFDPHTSAVPDTTSVSPGRCWDLETCWKRYPDVLVPFLGAGLLKGQKDFRGTVFRLPLRTVEQARVSEIARRPFTVASWQELLDQVLATREELLLFLKNVEELHVSEFLANARELREILSVRTANADTVRAAREEVLGVLRGDAAGIAQRLARRSPFVVSYEHGFSWRSQSGSGGGGGAREESSTWRVVACLALDPEGQIAEAIDELLERDNKAVPLGGAAARIARSGGAGQSARQFGGRVYCSLPLPLETGIPVHLNGFFDLDSSRQALTVESGQTGTARVRVRWNQLLFRHVIAPAYARLIHDLSQDLGERDAESYYALWPDTGGTLRRPFDTLATDVYKALTTLPVIRATGEKRWTSIRSVSIVPPAWPDLVEPLVAQGEALPEPALDARITAGFEVAEVRVRVWEPDRLRKLLRQDRSFAARPDEAPLACLRQRPWLESLLRFCLSDEARDLRGLPLALMADGVLRTFSHNAEVPIYLAGRQERAIFGSRPGWFVDEAFAESTGLGKIARLGLARMAPKEMLSRLQQLLPADATHLLRPEVTPAEFLNAGWLGPGRE